MQTPQARKIVFATIGSLGDLYPCLALAQELQCRGHQVVLASTPSYKYKVESLGIGFHPVRPAWNPTDPEIIRQCEDLRRGPEVLFRNIILPHLKATYEDLLAAATGTDLMIAGELVYAAPLVAEKSGIRWASIILSPCSFFSSHGPSLLVNVPWLLHFRKAGSPAYRAMLNLCRLTTRHWWRPVRDLRREIGLREQCDPVFRDKFSPDLVLALFSRCLAQPQPDWPSQTMQPGFIYYDQFKTDFDGSSDLTAFLAAGDPPLVFTLGSTAVHNPGNFYQASAEAAKQLGRRAILLGAKSKSRNHDILALPYAPYSQIFPHAAAIVHQGGSGTTGQALRAGRPQLIVPYGWDQPDNAARVERLGAGLCLARTAYTVSSAAAKLQQLLSNDLFSINAATGAVVIRNDGGTNSACNAIETLLQSS
jgi:UDP:flavonoid glycosyltransferase YjiC (YdhE family)